MLQPLYRDRFAGFLPILRYCSPFRAACCVLANALVSFERFPALPRMFKSLYERVAFVCAKGSNRCLLLFFKRSGPFRMVCCYCLVPVARLSSLFLRCYSPWCSAALFGLLRSLASGWLLALGCHSPSRAVCCFCEMRYTKAACCCFSQAPGFFARFAGILRCSSHQSRWNGLVLVISCPVVNFAWFVAISLMPFVQVAAFLHMLQASGPVRAACGSLLHASPFGTVCCSCSGALIPYKRFVAFQPLPKFSSTFRLACCSCSSPVAGFSWMF